MHGPKKIGVTRKGTANPATSYPAIRDGGADGSECLQLTNLEPGKSPPVHDVQYPMRLPGDLGDQMDRFSSFSTCQLACTVHVPIRRHPPRLYSGLEVGSQPTPAGLARIATRLGDYQETVHRYICAR